MKAKEEDKADWAINKKYHSCAVSWGEKMLFWVPNPILWEDGGSQRT